MFTYIIRLLQFYHRTHLIFVIEISTYALPLMNLGLYVLLNIVALEHANTEVVAADTRVVGNVVVSLKTYAVPTIIWL